MGDRRQELVFIGIDMQREELCATLNTCLLTDTETHQHAQQLPLADPFAEWPSLEQILDGGDEEADDASLADSASTLSGDEEEEDAAEPSTSAEGERAPEEHLGQKGQKRAAKGIDPGEGGEPDWRPGSLLMVQRGGAQVQPVLDALQPGAGVAVLAWHADWCVTCRTSVPALERYVLLSSPATAILVELPLYAVDMLILSCVRNSRCKIVTVMLHFFAPQS